MFMITKNDVYEIVSQLRNINEKLNYLVVSHDYSKENSSDDYVSNCDGKLLDVDKSQFNNKSGLLFTDISSESYRDYVLANGKTIRIYSPLYLHISSSGGHRLFDGKGYSWYIKPCESWYIKWKAEKGEPNFVM